MAPPGFGPIPFLVRRRCPTVCTPSRPRPWTKPATRTVASGPLAITVDTVALAPVIHLDAGNGSTIPNSDTGIPGEPATFTDNITADTVPILDGTAEPSAHIRLYDGATLLTELEANSVTGAWSYTIPGGSPLGVGVHDINATQVDIAGNVSPAGHLSVSIQTALPTDIATVTGITAATDSGEQSNDSLTKFTTPTLQGDVYTDATLLVKSHDDLVDVFFGGAQGFRRRC